MSAAGGPLVFPGWSPGLQAALERLTLAARRPARSPRPGAVRARTPERGLEFAGHRPYAPGDEPRRVDWKAYTRLRRLYVKQYQEERSRTLTLLVDASASLDWGSGEAHKGLYARRLAAALAWISLSHQEPVRAFVLRAGAAEPLPPAAGRTGAAGLWRQLAGITEAGGTGLADAVQAAARPGVPPGPVVLVSDLLDPDWAAALDALAATGEAAAVQVLAPGEWEPPLGEEVELQDAESGARVATRLGPAELEQYRARLQRYLAAVRAHCTRRGILHVALNTGTPLAESLLRQLPAAGLLTG